MTGWLETIVLAAFMAGLLGGLHCAAMCGGIVCLLNAQPQGKPRASPHWQWAIAYNAGRIVSYTTAGMLAGATGQAGLLLRGSMPVQHVLMLAAGVTLCLMAAYLAGISSWMRGLEAVGTVLWRRVEPLARRMLPVDTAGKALGLGAVWGWLPCGMVYAALLLALSTGNSVQGGLVMLAFGLGTLPNMLLMAGFAHRLRRLATQRGARLAVAGLLAATGLYGVVHAMPPGATVFEGYWCKVAPGWFGR
jgi:sulfite exporter TauE/SafE